MPRERVATGQCLERHQAPRVEVCAEVGVRISRRLLRGHVGWRAHRRTRLGERSPGRERARRREGLGNAEVRDHRRARGDEDVLGLDVAMHHAGVVRMLERLEHVAQHFGGFADCERAAREPRAQRFAAHVRHDVVQQAVRHAGIQQRQDMRMLQLRRGLDLGEEPLTPERCAKVRMQHLDGDIAVVLQVAREEDGGHPAGPELADDGVAIRQRCSETRLHAPIWYSATDRGKQEVAAFAPRRA